MFVTPAFAQAAAGQPPSLISQLPFFIAIFAIFYFLLIRPQQKKAKEHAAMIAAIRKGDRVVTAGGLVGKVIKVREDGELDLEIASGVTVRVIQQTIQLVRSKTDPA
jgi:preprotein translocase subunit YajC